VITEDTSLAGDVSHAADGDPIGHASNGGVQRGLLKRFVGRVNKPLPGKAFPTLLMLLVMTPAVLAGGLYNFQYRTDRATDLAAAKTAISAATDGTVAILSYSPDTLERDFSSAKSHLTGDFLSYYNEFTQQIVAPAAKQKSVKATAVVPRAAVSELLPDSAVVLVFVNLSTVSVDRPQPTFNESSVVVTLAKVNGAWLISKFEPV
jgi:Mce-associated membrane protein